MATKTKGLFSGVMALLLGLALPQQVSAQQETQRHYRVELIVVRHLSGSSDTAPQETLRDFTQILDLHAPPAESNTPAGSSGNPKTDTLSGDSDLLGDELSKDQPLAVRIDDMSDTMRETWRRLRGSAGFRPELFRAWEQPGGGPFPQLRIHDDEVLFTIDPATQPSTLVSNVPVDEHGALVFSDATLQRKAESGHGSQPTNEPEPIENYYRIDGTATLTRTRFLHLNLDIELREPLFGLAGTDPRMELTEDPLVADPARHTQTRHTQIRTGPAADAPAFRLHQIQQRRQVKTEQMEYFDGPVIGVLALITGFDVVAEMPEPETLQP